jgi:hypothetical protein
MNSLATNNTPSIYKEKIEPLLCDCTIDELRSISSSISEKALSMSDELSKTVTVDDFKKRMKSSTQSIPTQPKEQSNFMSPSGGIAHDDGGDTGDVSY